MTTQAETAPTSALRPEWTNARRIVVKIGSALLADRATGQLKADWLDLADRRRRRARRAPARRSCSSRRARSRSAATALKLPKGALELEQSQAAAAVGQISLAHAYQELCRARGLDRRADPADARRHRGAPPLSQRAPHHRDAAGARRRSRSSTRTTRWRPPRSATATTTGCRRASPRMVSADCLVLLSDIDGLYTAPPNAERRCARTSRSSPRSRPRSRPWRATPAPSCRRAA